MPLLHLERNHVYKPPPCLCTGFLWSWPGSMVRWEFPHVRNGIRCLNSMNCPRFRHFSTWFRHGQRMMVFMWMARLTPTHLENHACLDRQNVVPGDLTDSKFGAKLVGENQCSLKSLESASSVPPFQPAKACEFEFVSSHLQQQTPTKPVVKSFLEPL